MSKRLFGEDKSYLKVYQLDNGYQFASRKAQPVIEGNEHPDAVVIVANDADGRLLVIREYRPAVGDYIWALPAGLVEPGESILSAAAREIWEETGLTVDLSDPGMYNVYENNFASPGFTDEKVAVVRCFVKGELSNKNLQSDEKIESYLMSPDDMLRAGFDKSDTKMSIWLTLQLL